VGWSRTEIEPSWRKNKIKKIQYDSADPTKSGQKNKDTEIGHWVLYGSGKAPLLILKTYGFIICCKILKFIVQREKDFETISRFVLYLDHLQIDWNLFFFSID